jgi:alpha-beta hydrolase superfamily lysophospholipase
MSFQMRILHRLLMLVAPHVTFDLPGDKNEASSDPVLVQRYWDDPLCHRFMSAAFGHVFQEGRREILPLGHELERPILLLEAGSDTVADPDGAEDLWRAVPQGLLERRRLEGFKHEILHDLRRNEAQAIAAQWLERMLDQWLGNPQPLAAMFVQGTKESR